MKYNTEYELTGITTHFGVIDFGHYYNIIKGPDKKRYKFNDIYVSEFKEEDIPKEAFGDKEILEEDSYKEKENFFCISSSIHLNTCLCWYRDNKYQ